MGLSAGGSESSQGCWQTLGFLTTSVNPRRDTRTYGVPTPAERGQPSPRARGLTASLEPTGPLYSDVWSLHRQEHPGRKEGAVPRDLPCIARERGALCGGLSLPPPPAPWGSSRRGQLCTCRRQAQLLQHRSPPSRLLHGRQHPQACLHTSPRRTPRSPTSSSATRPPPLAASSPASQLSGRLARLLHSCVGSLHPGNPS